MNLLDGIRVLVCTMSIISQAELTPVQMAAVDYVNAGLVIVPVFADSKRPAGGRGWQREHRAIRTVEKAEKIEGSVGLADLWAGIGVVDADQLMESVEYLDAHGVDLTSMLMAESVQISSGRDNRAKLLYRLPDSVKCLPTYQYQLDGEMVLELRCGDKTGQSTAMDVLPPSMHPDGQPYTWIGDWRNIPAIPKPLLEFWQSVTSYPDSAKPSNRPDSHKPYLEEIFLLRMLP